MMVGIHNYECKHRKPIAALKHARDISAEYLLKSVPATPRVVNYYNAAAKALMAMDRAKGSPYQKIIHKAFAKRKIISPQIKMLSNLKWDEVRPLIQKEDEVINNSNGGMIVRLSRQETLRIDKGKKEISAMSVGGYDLAKLDLEVPTDFYYEFDQNGNLIDEVLPRLSDVRQAAYACVMSIMQEGSVGENADTMWGVENNKLVRTYIE